MTRSSVRLASVAASFIAACGCTAAASAVTNISQTRMIKVGAFYVPPIWLTESTTAAGVWNKSATVVTPGFSSKGSATQTSIVSGNRLSGSATVTANDDVQVTWGYAEASYLARFEVTEPTSYSLIGSWNVDYNYNYSLESNARMTFRRLSSDPLTFYDAGLVYGDGFYTNSGTVSLNGELEPGIYEISASVYIDVSAPGQYFHDGGFNFDLIVPSPGAASVLLLSGVGVLGRSRRV